MVSGRGGKWSFLFNLFCFFLLFFNLIFYFIFLLVLKIYFLFIYHFLPSAIRPHSPFPHVTVPFQIAFVAGVERSVETRDGKNPFSFSNSPPQRVLCNARRDRGFSLLRLIFCIFIVWSISANVGAFSFLNKNCKGRKPKRLSLEFATLPLVRSESANYVCAIWSVAMNVKTSERFVWVIMLHDICC